MIDAVIKPSDSITTASENNFIIVSFVFDQFDEIDKSSKNDKVIKLDHYRKNKPNENLIRIDYPRTRQETFALMRILATSTKAGLVLCIAGNNQYTVGPNGLGALYCTENKQFPDPKNFQCNVTYDEFLDMAEKDGLWKDEVDISGLNQTPTEAGHDKLA